MHDSKFSLRFRLTEQAEKSVFEDDALKVLGEWIRTCNRNTKEK